MALIGIAIAIGIPIITEQVRIATASDRSMKFKWNRSVDVASAIILESDVSGARERWTATVNAMGRPKLAHERVN